VKIHSQSKLVMIGDSITDCGRARPIAEASHWDSLGNGYVSIINAFLTATMPDENIRIVNMGTGGNTVSDLAARWSTDVLDLKPNWLSVMIGINDVWRQFDARLQTENHIRVDVYTQTLSNLLANTRPQLKGLVLMSPYFIEPNRADPMRTMMDQYGAAMRELAKQHDAIFVDTQAAFDKVLTTLQPMALAIDRVHSNQTGHTILARAFLNAVDYTW